MIRPAFDLIHDKGYHACGKIGWRCAVNPEEKPEGWPPMCAIFKVDGSHPRFRELIFCGACGQPIYGLAGNNFSARPIKETP